MHMQLLGYVTELITNNLDYYQLHSERDQILEMSDLGLRIEKHRLRITSVFSINALNFQGCWRRREYYKAIRSTMDKGLSANMTKRAWITRCATDRSDY